MRHSVSHVHGDMVLRMTSPSYPDPVGVDLPNPMSGEVIIIFIFQFILKRTNIKDAVLVCAVVFHETFPLSAFFIKRETCVKRTRIS